MAVQQNKKSVARRGNRRAHDFLKNPPTAVEATTGEVHRRHHISPTGFYRARRSSRRSRTNKSAPNKPVRFCSVNEPRARCRAHPTVKVLFAKGFSLTSGSLEGQELLKEAAGAIRKEGDPEVGPLFHACRIRLKSWLMFRSRMAQMSYAVWLKKRTSNAGFKSVRSNVHATCL